MEEKTPGPKGKVIYLQAAVKSVENEKLDGYMKDLEKIIQQVRSVAIKHGYDARTVLSDSMYKLVETEIVDYCEK